MSEVKVNKISPRTNCGTVTLGDSGDSFVIPSGATITNNGTQTGFGRTGTVDWQTTPKTGNFTAVNGEGYFVNTTSGVITMTMPSGSAGNIVSIQDYNKTFDTNNFTISPASGQKINGGVADGDLVITTEGQGLTFVYVDSTVGWKTVQDNDFTLVGSDFITATGGTITTSGNCKIHTFTGPGTFCVSVGGSPTNGVVSYMVIAGGGGGSGHYGGGGGAGGFREFKSPVTPYTASPLDGNPGGTSISILSAAAFPITVGGGGAGGSKVCGPTGCGTSGSNSTFSTITSTAGGGGGNGTSSAPQANASPGGSGGGGGSYGPNSGGTGGTGNTPPVTPAQGTNGGNGNRCTSTHTHGGGGGGASAVGQNAGGCSQGGPAYGSGGAGVTSSINGTPTARAGGGGGSVNSTPTNPVGGVGGGGLGGSPGNTSAPTVQGTVNTGGGAGGINGNNPIPAGGSGGSGIVIIRYKFQ